MLSEVKLMTPEEMQTRHQKQEDPFRLVLDKWSRIQSFLGRAFSQEDFVAVLEAAQVTIPFCLDLGARNACTLCPIIRICQSPPGRSGKPLERRLPSSAGLCLGW